MDSGQGNFLPDDAVILSGRELRSERAIHENNCWPETRKECKQKESQRRLFFSRFTDRHLFFRVSFSGRDLFSSRKQIIVMLTVKEQIADPVTRGIRKGYRDVCDFQWSSRTGILVGTSAAVLTGTYLLYRYMKRTPKAEPRKPLGKLSNGSVIRTLPVTSKARTALEVDETDGAVRPNRWFDDVNDGSCVSRVNNNNSSVLFPPVFPHTSNRKRNDSLSSIGTTTLMIKNRSPSELLLYGLESLKRSIRLFEEARNKLIMTDESFGSASRENSVDSELEFILSKAKQLQDDCDSYLRESFPEEVTLIPDQKSGLSEDLMNKSMMSNRSETSGQNLLLSPDAAAGGMSRTASNSSIATTITMPFFDIEPNVHFFKFYTSALDEWEKVLEPRTDRTKQMLCDNRPEFIAKVHCLREAFSQILTFDQNKRYFMDLGLEILQVVLNHSPKDPTACIESYEEMLSYISEEGNLKSIANEVATRKIPSTSFYDLVLDYMVLESFDDLENPPSAVTSVANNRWLSSGFRELALQTAVSAVLKHKRSKVMTGGFFDHFYSITEHISPILAWGFLGSDIELKLKCNYIRDAILRLVRGYFSFDRVRYTSLIDLTDDILRITDEEYEQLKMLLSACSR